MLLLLLLIAHSSFSQNKPHIPILLSPEIMESTKNKKDLEDTVRKQLKMDHSEDVILTKVMPQIIEPKTKYIKIVQSGKSIIFHRSNFERTNDGLKIWTGDLRPGESERYHSANEVKTDPLNTAKFVLDGDKLTAFFTINGDGYRVTPIKNGLHAITKVPGKRIPLDGRPRINPHPQKFVTAPKSAHSTIRVMVVTTNQTRKTVKNIDALIALAFSQSNQGNKNSHVNITFEDVGTLNLDYDERGDQDDMLDHISIIDDKKLGKPVHEAREERKADIVALIVDDYSFCGLADMIEAPKGRAFLTVSHRCLGEGDYTFAHEIGHVIGVDHDWPGESAHNPAYPSYIYGYFVGKDKWHSIMSSGRGCTGCSEINYWSNPDVTYKGVPMGTVDNNNVARRLNERREIVSNFYPDKTTRIEVKNPGAETGNMEGWKIEVGEFRVVSTQGGVKPASGNYFFTGRSNGKYDDWDSMSQIIPLGKEINLNKKTEATLSFKSNTSHDDWGFVTLEALDARGAVIGNSYEYTMENEVWTYHQVNLMLPEATTQLKIVVDSIKESEENAPPAVHFDDFSIVIN